MTRQLKQQVAHYYVSNALINLSMCMIGTTYILFLRKVGLSFFEIGAINIACILIKNLCNTPTGVLADWWGRKNTFVLACFVTGLTAFLYYFARSLLHCLLIEALAGVGIALLEGSLTAHIVDKINDRSGGSTNRILSVGGALNCATSLIGGWAGAYLGRGNLAVPFLAMGGFAFVATIYGFLTLDEPSNGNERKKTRGWFKESVAGIREVLSNETLFIMVTASVASGFIMQVFIKMWTPFLKPLVGSQESFGWIWAVLMAGAFLGNVVSYFVKNNHLLVFLVSRIPLAFSLPLCVFLPGMVPKALSLGMLEMMQGMIHPLFNAEANKHIASEKRATIISAISTIASTGSLLGLLSGVIADRYSIAMVWILTGAISLVVFLWVLFRYSKSLCK